MPRRGRGLIEALRLQWRAAPLASTAGYVMALLPGRTTVAAGWWMRGLIDELALGTAGSAGRAVGLVVATAATAGVAAAAGHVNVYLSESIRWRVSLVIERELFRKVAGLVGLRELETPTFQGQLRLAQQAALEAPQLLSHLTLSLITATAAISSAIVAVWLFIPSMVWVLLIAAGAGLAAEIHRSRKEAELTEALVQTYRWRDYHRTLLTDLHAAKEIRLFDLGDLLLTRLLGSLRRISSRELSLTRTNAVIRSGLALMSMSMAVTILGAVLVVRGRSRVASTSATSHCSSPPSPASSRARAPSPSSWPPRSAACACSATTWRSSTGRRPRPRRAARSRRSATRSSCATRGSATARTRHGSSAASTSASRPGRPSGWSA